MNANSYISDKSFNSFFWASVLTSLVAQMQTLMDGLIVSNLVSPHAISAVNLAAPILGILTLIPMMFSSGASILAANEIGAQNHKEASLHFTISTLSSFVITLVLGVSFCFFSGCLAHLLTKEEQLLPLVEDYFPPILAGFSLMTLSMMLATFIKLAGHPIFVTKTVFIQFISNVILDLLFVGLFGMGIKGAAIATILSALISVLIFLPFLVRGKPIRFVRIDWSRFRGILSDEMKKGIPIATSQLSVIVLVVCLNTIILHNKGADGLFILTVTIQMLLICSLVLQGAGGAITNIGGIMLGERNLDGYRNLVKGTLLKIIVIVAVSSAVMICFPGFLAKVFGASGDFLDSVIVPIREMCFMFLPFCICTFYSSFLVLQNHKTFAALIGVGITVFMVPSLLLSAKFLPGFFWMSIPAGMWLLFITMLASTNYISWKNPVLNRFTLIPSVPDDPSVNLSLPYSKEAVLEALTQIKLFINVSELSFETREAIFHSIEELSVNIIDMNNAIGKKGFFDIRVVHTPKQIFVYIKDDSVPYNPIRKYNPTDTGEISFEQMKYIIANFYCPDIKYNYMNGINCIGMKFDVSVA